MGGERPWWWLYPLRMTEQYCLASMVAWLSSTGISHHNLLPHIPSICPSTVSSSPHPGIAPQSLKSSSQPLHLPGDLPPCPGYVWLWEGLSNSHSIYAATDQLFFFQTYMFFLWLSCPNVGIGSLLQFPHRLRAGPVLLKLLFSPLVPSSYQVLPGSVYSFPLVRYSCLLLAGVLHGLLCLKVYSWCIRGERCTPRPPTPLPSCSLLKLIFNLLLLKAKTSQGNRTHNLYPVPGIFHTCVISCPGWLMESKLVLLTTQ